MATATTIDPRTSMTDATPKALAAIDLLDRSNMPRCIESVIDAPHVRGVTLVLRELRSLAMDQHGAVCEWLVGQDWTCLAINIRGIGGEDRLTVLAQPCDTFARQLEAL